MATCIHWPTPEPEKLPVRLCQSYVPQLSSDPLVICLQLPRKQLWLWSATTDSDGWDSFSSTPPWNLPLTLFRQVLDRKQSQISEVYSGCYHSSQFQSEELQLARQVGLKNGLHQFTFYASKQFGLSRVQNTMTLIQVKSSTLQWL